MTGVKLADLKVSTELKDALFDYENTMIASYNRFTERFNERTKGDTRSRYADGIRYTKGPKYLRVINSDENHTTVHSFINLGNPKFEFGDVLMSRGWKSPATNHARGNIFGKYGISWTGANYLI
jgi:hypothetical protein